MECRIIALEARWEAVIPTSASKADLPELRVQIREVLHHSAIATRAHPSACDELLADIRQISADIRQMSADIKFWTRVTVVAIPGTMLAALLGLGLFDRAASPPSQIIIITVPGTPSTK